MSSLEEASLGHPLRFPIRTEPFSSPYMANMMLGTSPRIINSLMPPVLQPVVVAPGTIREYSQVGDGVHLRQQRVPLQPLIERTRTRTRPHTLVRKVTVVGSHVLRYVGRQSSLTLRRHQLRNVHRVRMSRLDQHLSDYNYDLVENVDWLANDDDRTLPNSGLLQLQPESYAVRLMLTAGTDDSSALGIFNWKIYVGMLCIIAMQALLKLAYQEMCSMS